MDTLKPAENAPPANATRDTLLQGRLTLWQPARKEGYRFNLDPVLLAGFAPSGEVVVDLGTGCGVVGLLLLAKGKAKRVVGVEAQLALADLARRNAVANSMKERMDVLSGDLRELELPAADLVVFNPPYFAAGRGNPSGNSGRDAARHERLGTLRDFVQASARCLQGGGHVAAILRAERREEITNHFAEVGMSVAVRPVVSRPGDVPRNILVRAEADEKPTANELEPLIVHDGEEYSGEVKGFLQECEL